MTTATAPTSPASKLGTRGALAGLLIVLLGAGAGWWAYSQSVPRPADASDFRPDPGGRRGNWAMGGNNNPAFAPRPREPVNILPRVVTIRDAELTISSSMRTDSNWNIFVSFNGESLAGRDPQRLMLAVRRVLDMRTPPANLKLTDAQRTALAAIPLVPLELTDDQLRQLIDLLNQSQKLSANAPELAAIKQSMQSIAAQAKAVDQNAVKARYADRDAKFRTILSAEQIETLLAGPGNRNPVRTAPPTPPNAPA